MIIGLVDKVLLNLLEQNQEVNQRTTYGALTTKRKDTLKTLVGNWSTRINKNQRKHMWQFLRIKIVVRFL